MNSSQSGELGNVFADALVETVSKISGISLCGISDEADFTLSDMTGMTILRGKKNAVLFISASERDISVLCADMTGVSPEDVTKDDVRDTLCELVNMAAGGAKLRLGYADYALALPTPIVIEGGDMTMTVKKRINIFFRTLGNGGVSLKLKVIFSE